MTRSAVREWRVESALKADVVGRGIESDMVIRRGRRSSTISGSGGEDNGEKRGYESD